jgi:hypothetical protein
MRRLHRRFCATLALAALIAANSACSHFYVPRQVPITEVEIAGFQGRPGVELRNVAAEGRVLIGSQGFHRWYGDHRAWTDAAITLMSGELAARGAQVGGGSAKSLDLEVSGANLIWGFAAIRCILNLRATTADGRVFAAEGNNASPGTVYRAMDGALSRAVAGLLTNPGLRAYLEGS